MIQSQHRQGHPASIHAISTFSTDLHQERNATSRPLENQTDPAAQGSFLRRQAAKSANSLKTMVANNPVCYKIASTRDEREKAFQLVYESYVEAGLADPNPYKMRVSPYHLLPTTQTFVANSDSEMIFTASLVLDNATGLPMESIYPGEIARRRQRGKSLAEVSCLADRRPHLRESQSVFLTLCRLVFQYAHRQQIDQLLIAVHPRHAGFYRRKLRFKTMGNQRDYPSVRNRPAVPLVLDFAATKAEHPKEYDSVFGESLSDDLLQGQSITSAQRDYFASMIDRVSCEAA